VFDVLFGGARGGGKSDACLGDWFLHAMQYGEAARGLFLRKELPQLEETIRRSKEIYFAAGAQWSEQAKRWVFPNGATINFRACLSGKTTRRSTRVTATRGYMAKS
jgi:hypothetical protein